MSVISVKAPLEAVRTLNEYKEIQALLSRFKRTGEKYSQGVCYCTNLAEGMREALFANLVQDDKEKCAVVTMEKEYSDEQLNAVIENEGYTVTDIR